MTTQNFVTLPREVVEQAIESLGSFVSDHGWAQSDMDTMDMLIAALTEQESAVNTTGAHATHCYQGEYAHSCKYGNDHCPMKTCRVTPLEEWAQCLQSKPAEPVNQVLLDALVKLRRCYVNLLESGRDRILFLGGQCDAVDVMEASDPYLRNAVEAIAQAQTEKLELLIDQPDCWMPIPAAPGPKEAV